MNNGSMSKVIQIMVYFVPDVRRNLYLVKGLRQEILTEVKRNEICSIPFVSEGCGDS